MQVKPGQAVTVEFSVQDANGAIDADATPTGTLVQNGTDLGTTVSVTRISQGVYKAAMTIPGDWVAGDTWALRIYAVVDGYPWYGVIHGTCDGKRVSDLQDLSQANIRTAVGLAAANLDGQLSAMPTAVRGELGTELARVDATISSRASSASVAAIAAALSSLATAVAGIAAAVWSYALRTLSSPTAAAATADTTELITRRRGDTWTIPFAGLDSLAGCIVQFTVKTQRNQTDEQARLLVTNADGLTRLNGAEAADSSQASISISDEAAGDITITVDAAATADLVPDELAYDVQVTTAAGIVSTPIDGILTVTADVSRAV